MKAQRPLPKRKFLRLREYDYSSAGLYFITICLSDRTLLLGSVAGAEVKHSALGRIVEETWYRLTDFYPNADLDSFIVMPNHVHGIIGLREVLLTPELPQGRRGSLSEVVRGFKSMSSRAMNLVVGERPVEWQRGFYEHIVRDERDLARIREYIDRNPIEWTNDPENPERAQRYRR